MSYRLHEWLNLAIRWTHVFAGASDRDAAAALADRLRAEGPEARIDVQPGGEMVWQVRPANPFTVFFGGLGG